MTRRELFERLHAFFMGSLERRYLRPARVPELVLIIGKHRDRKDNTIYSRYLRKKDPLTPSIAEMQRMCGAWRRAGLRGIDIRVSLVLEEV